MFLSLSAAVIFLPSPGATATLACTSATLASATLLSAATEFLPCPAAAVLLTLLGGAMTWLCLAGFLLLLSRIVVDFSSSPTAARLGLLLLVSAATGLASIVGLGAAELFLAGEGETLVLVCSSAFSRRILSIST